MTNVIETYEDFVGELLSDLGYEYKIIKYPHIHTSVVMVKDVPNAEIKITHRQASNDILIDFLPVNGYECVWSNDRQENIYAPNNILLNKPSELSSFAYHFSQYIKFIKLLNANIIKQKRDVENTRQRLIQLDIIGDERTMLSKECPGTMGFFFKHSAKFGASTISFNHKEMVFEMRMPLEQGEKLLKLIEEHLN